MDGENPTGGDAGASIIDRLDRYLGAESGQEDQQQGQHGDDDDGGGSDTSSAQNGRQRDPDANAQQQHDDDHEGDGDGDAAPQYTTADFAKVMGIDESALDVDADGNVFIKTKVDGKEGTAKFSDVLKSYQLQGHVDNQAREVAAQKQQLAQQLQQADEAAQQRLTHLDQVINTVGEQLLAEFQSIDWAGLRASDPGQYSALLSDMNARKAQLDQAAARAQQERATITARQQEQAKQQMAQEHARMLDLIPEWKDEATARKEAGELRDWGLKAGFAPETLDNLSSAVAVQAMRKAMLYDRLQAGKADVENKVRTAPKIVKAGPAQPAARDPNNLRSLKANIKASGGAAKDVAALLMATGRA